jgi:serine protease Do
MNLLVWLVDSDHQGIQGGFMKEPGGTKVGSLGRLGRFCSVFLLVFACSWAFSSSASAGTKAKGHGLYATARRAVRGLQSLVAELGPAIVVVKTPSGIGTGWFCNKDGYLITNHHVVAGERNIRVTLFPRQGKSFGRKVFSKVRIVALNAQMDLALLKIEEPLRISIPQLYMGDSGKVKVGDKAFAIGNPMGLERSTSQGIVSKVSRNIGGRLFIQTTAPIAPGNSGGPLFNERGEVIGVVSRGAILLDGLGFAIPASYVKEFLENVEAFAYDADNPNTGVTYMETPVSASGANIRFTDAEFIRVGHGLSCLQVADLNGDSVSEIVFADNHKSEIGILRKRKQPKTSKRILASWDVNQLPESRRFALQTVPIGSRVTAIALGDLDGDNLLDVVYHGDLDGLAVLRTKKDGSVEMPRRLDDVQISGLDRAIRVVDLDADGHQDVFVLGRDRFSVFWDGHKLEAYSLDAPLRSKVNQVQFLDVDGDGKQDVVFFSAGQHFGVSVRMQQAHRKFTVSQPLKIRLNGPVQAYRSGKALSFATLDVGVNRVRQLRFGPREAESNRSWLPAAVFSIPVSSGSHGMTPFDVADVDADGLSEIATVDQKRNEFVLIDYDKKDFHVRRTPAPRNVVACRLYRSPQGQEAVFSFSKDDNLLGVSQVKQGRIVFPRPINVAGEVQWMQFERLRGWEGNKEEQAVLLWGEKSDSGQVIRLARADEITAQLGSDGTGSMDVACRTLTFGRDEKSQKAPLPGKLKRLAFADFNDDGLLDVVVFWAYSDKESLYLGLGGGRFRRVIRQQRLIEDKKNHALLVQDIDGDGKQEVLQIQPGFVRVMHVDAKDRLVIQGQFNWKNGRLNRLVPYATEDRQDLLLAVNGRRASVVKFHPVAGEFKTLARLDLTGLDLGPLRVADVDGDHRPDLVSWLNGEIRVLLNQPQPLALIQSTAYNASLAHLSFFNLVAADFDGDRNDEILLFDRRQSVIQILHRSQTGQLRPIFRHRLFFSQFSVRAGGDQNLPMQPREIATGDVSGNGKTDLVLVLFDRIAIYLQSDG